jgi:carboxypeptidase Taq
VYRAEHTSSPIGLRSTDEAAHPFSGGVSDDSRITSRYDENNVIGSIMAIVHESSHSRLRNRAQQELMALSAGGRQH